MNNIFLTGFMSTGKSVISRELSRIMNRIMIDTDDMVENDQNMKISDIFEKFGEEYFRDIETKMLQKASVQENIIISTGGGMVLRSENREIMKNNGIIVALIPEFSVIEQRLNVSKKTRPLLNDDIINIKKRFELRLPLYKQCDIEIKVSNDKKPSYFAKEIVENIKMLKKRV